MAGHSKWANIKHRKARQDAKRGKAWSKCSKAIMAAARMGGGDPDTNLNLRYAIEEAKAENMPKDTIQNAIDKATGNLEGVHYEQVVYEGYAPAGVAVMLDCLTDNKNRTVPEIRKLFEKHGGNLGESGCVAFNFTPRGQIAVDKQQTDEDTLMSLALEAGGEDLLDDGDTWRILCDPADFDSLRQAIEQADLSIASAQSRAMVPGSTITVTGDDAAKVLRLLDALEDHDDVQRVYANLDIPDDEIAALQDA